MFNKTPIAAALLGLALTATPAFAQAIEPTQVKVEYKDLDLTSEQGQRKLDRRLAKAARGACGYNAPAVGSRLPSAHANNCYKQARAKGKNAMALAISNAAGSARLGG